MKSPAWALWDAVRPTFSTHGTPTIEINIMAESECSRQTGPDPGPPPESRPARKTIPSDQLLQGSREVQIAHAGETYRLLVTRNNKLILQK
jgi:hemin uptake protein HemP